VPAFVHFGSLVHNIFKNNYYGRIHPQGLLVAQHQPHQR
jgi:hypothetical protein